KQMKEGSQKKGSVAPPTGSAEQEATRAITKRRQELGDKGRSDREEKLPEAERQETLTQELVKTGVPEPEAKEIAVEWVDHNYKVLFQEADIPGQVFFDVKPTAGTIIININTRHPAHEHFFGLLRKEGAEADSPELKALKLILSAWGRLED